MENRTANQKKRLSKKQLVKHRIFDVMVVFLALFLIVGGRVFQLQVIEAEELQQKATGQWTGSTTVAAKRGKITDVNGIVLAQSGTSDTLVCNIKDVTDPEGIAQSCVDILGLDYDTVYTKITDKTKSQVVIKRQLTQEQSEAFHALGYKGLDYTVDTKRYYPLKNFLSQVIGFTTVDGVGQNGIEAAYDKYLAGTAGKIVYEKDGYGREIPLGSETYVEPVDGYNVALTVDAVIQSSLESAVTSAMEINNASYAMGVVMEVDTGAVKAIVVKPDFDLNNPPRNDLTQLSALSRNKAVADVFEPGSVFKIITLTAAIEEGVVTENSTFHCPGYLLVDGQRIKCWTSGHGHQSLADAVSNSCNPVFMQLALNMGSETFYEYLYNFGFGSSTGSGMSGETGGIVRDVQYVTRPDLARIGFGQSIATTAIQMATAVSAAVNGGNLMQPYIVSEVYSNEGETILKNAPTLMRQVVSEETSALVRKLLVGVVEKGSGKNAAIPGYEIGGKTGTSQKYADGAIAIGSYTSSFLCFAPANDPQYLVYMVVDEPTAGAIYGSTVAAPYARDVMEDILQYYNIPTFYEEGEEAVERNVEVPDAYGMSAEEARQLLREAGFDSTADGNGAVVAQSPQAGAEVPGGTCIQLYMSESTEEYDLTLDEVIVPDLTKQQVGAAYEQLKALGLELQSTGDSRGVIASQNPAAGTSVPEGTRITVVVRYGEEE